jgi:hypothetical protein
VPSMQHVKCAKRDANLFALGFEFFDVIEYHLTDLRAPIANVSGVYITTH